MKKVKCLSEKCNGRLIAFIDEKRRLQLPSNNPEDMWLLAYVPAPGYTGFQCKCGNDTRKEEDKAKFLVEE